MQDIKNLARKFILDNFMMGTGAAIADDDAGSTDRRGHAIVSFW